ncbi:hypothetical protein ACLB2K_063100 [Fragaria x ananassa]
MDSRRSGGFFSSPAALPARTLGWGERGGGRVRTGLEWQGPNRAGVAAGCWLDGGSWRQAFRQEELGKEFREKKRRERREEIKKKKLGCHPPAQRSNPTKINPLQIFPFLPTQKLYHLIDNFSMLTPILTHSIFTNS